MWPVFDCQSCGACCCNTPENRQAGFQYYVQIDDDDDLLRRKDLVRRLVILDNQNVPHLKLDRDGRCLALKGKIGRSVSCGIYHWRPSPCRKVEAGSKLCLGYRKAAGLED